MNGQQLRPCPGCGSTRIEKYGGMSGGHDSWPRVCIMCSDCGLQTTTFVDIEDAVRRWNDPSSARAANEAKRAAAADEERRRREAYERVSPEDRRLLGIHPQDR